MLMKSAFAILAAVIATGPAVGSDVAQAQAGIAQQCWHDGDPKHFHPECRDLEKFVAPTRPAKQKSIDGPVPNVPRNQARFDPDNLFDQMMRDSGGGAGDGGGGGGGGR